MHSLPVFLRLAGRTVILLGTGEAMAAKWRLLERAGAHVAGEDATDAAIAIVAITDDVEARAAIARLKARGLLVNAVDRPDQCDFTLPAIVDRDPVLVAIGTGGASAGLAKALRILIEGLLPDRLGLLATMLSGARDRIRARWPDARARRLALDVALAPGGALDPLGEAADVEGWIARGGEAVPELVRIAVRSDDPDCLTLREARLLGRADHVYYGPGVAPAILARARADAGRTAASAPPVSVEGLVLWLERV